MQKFFLLLLLTTITAGFTAGVLGTAWSRSYLDRYAASLEESAGRTLQLSEQKPRAVPGTFEESLAAARQSLEATAVLFYAASSDPTIMPGTAVGAGVVVTSDGWIATTKQTFDAQNHGGKLVNRAVVGDGVYALGETVSDEATDLVMVKLVEASGLPVVAFGASDQTQSGDLLFAALESGGVLPTSLASARQWSAALAANPVEQFLTNFALADQVIIAGSPVVNSAGELVALTLNKTEGDAGGVGALPLYQMLPAVKSVIRSGEISRPWLGMSVVELALVRSSPLARGFTHGAVVTAVAVGSPAALGGLKKGDIILRFAESPLSTKTIAEELLSYSLGDAIVLTIDRAGEEKQFTVELGAK